MGRALARMVMVRTRGLTCQSKAHHHQGWQDPCRRSLQGDLSQAEWPWLQKQVWLCVQLSGTNDHMTVTFMPVHRPDGAHAGTSGAAGLPRWGKQCSTDGAKPASGRHSRLGGFLVDSLYRGGHEHKAGPQELGHSLGVRHHEGGWRGGGHWLGKSPGSAWLLPSVTSAVSGSLRL